MLLLTLGPRRRSLEIALAESAQLLAMAEREQRVAVGAWVVEDGPHLCLGALQVAGRLLRDVSGVGVPVVRRSTSGTAAAVDGGVLVAIALPSIDAVHRDASPRTVINRNVRPLLAGLRRAGVAATYLGRDFISVDRRPFALLGLDATFGGAVLIEALATRQGTLALPRAVVTDLEAGTPRLGGARPLSLREAGIDDLDAFARAFLEGVSDRLGAEREAVEVEALPGPTVDRSTSPLLEGARLLEPVSVPIGWLDLGWSGGMPWIGGDVLTATYALGSSFELGGSHVPMEGAVWDDVRRAAMSFRP